MSKREANVCTRLRGRLLRPGDRFDRVENGLGAGTPDINYCFLSVEGWIEVKAPIEPARPSTALFPSNHEVTTEQRNWFLAQRLARGRAYLFIATEQRLLLIGSDLACTKEVNQLTVGELEARALWKSLLPVKNDLVWADLREILTS